MPSPTVAIGITTYRDLSGEGVAKAVWQALSATDPRLTPQAINTHEPVNVPLGGSTVDAPESWLRYWPWGALWRRRTSIQGIGAEEHRIGRQDDSSLSLHFRWNPTVDWWSIFLKLCAATDPAYGMLHLFTPEERRPLDYQAFDGAVTGELAFTSKVAADGNFVRPDSRDAEARRNWRFLPELSWGNHLGREFASAYDPEALRLSTVRTRRRRLRSVQAVRKDRRRGGGSRELPSRARSGEILLRPRHLQGSRRTLRLASPLFTSHRFKCPTWPQCRTSSQT